MTWSSRGRSEKCGILLAHSTKVKSCLSAAWQILVTGSLVWTSEQKQYLKLAFFLTFLLFIHVFETNISSRTVSATGGQFISVNDCSDQVLTISTSPTVGFLIGLTTENVFLWNERSDSHRVPGTAVAVRLCFGLHSQLGIQDLVHGHLLVETAGRLNLVLPTFLPTLPFFLHRYTHTHTHRRTNARFRSNQACFHFLPRISASISRVCSQKGLIPHISYGEKRKMFLLIWGLDVMNVPTFKINFKKTKQIILRFWIK